MKRDFYRKKDRHSELSRQAGCNIETLRCYERDRPAAEGTS
jgi:hypothetical protein